MSNFHISIVPNLLNMGIQLAATLVLYFILRHFLYKPVKEFLEKREAYIADNIRESEEAKREASTIREKYESQIANAKSEAAEIVANARTFGEEIKVKSIQESKEESDRIYQNGIRRLEQERRKVINSLNSDIVDMAMMGTEKVLREKSGNDLDRKILEDFVADMEAYNE